MPALRSLMTRALAAIGLASAGTVRVLRERLDAAETRADALSTQVATVKAEAQSVKSRVEELKAQLAAARTEAQASKSRADEVARELAALQSDLSRSRAQVQELTAKIATWRTKGDRIKVKLARAERAVQVANEHLMSTETKLDLVEAAITVLDTRTRRPRSGSASPASDDGQVT
ncbi:MAG: hypothetical protein AB1806_18335 [Acidobacteriota bacterium]